MAKRFPKGRDAKPPTYVFHKRNMVAGSPKEVTMTMYKNAQTFLFTICILLFATTSSQAASATFSWTANSESVSGYKIYYGTSSRNYNFVVDVGLPDGN